ncbi:MAG: hypothetical protein GY926_23215 [bacterium]|nr:hypothetical protein [bacterium]
MTQVIGLWGDRARAPVADRHIIEPQPGPHRRESRQQRLGQLRIVIIFGVPLEEVADVLGHDEIRMTALVYRHADSPRRERKINRSPRAAEQRLGG